MAAISHASSRNLRMSTPLLGGTDRATGVFADRTCPSCVSECGEYYVGLGNCQGIGQTEIIYGSTVYVHERPAPKRLRQVDGRPVPGGGARGRVDLETTEPEDRI